ncbi:MAG: hypothetical protein V4631_08625 [Pseudomonadota bacterium]
MIVQLSRLMIAVSVACVLAACGGDDAASAAVAARTEAAPQSAPASFVPAQAPVAAVAPAAIHPAALQLVTESERRAEELRLVDFETSYSIELNRRSQEQADRAQRAALSLQAGVVQGPGCEGSEGHAAQECERSLM